MDIIIDDFEHSVSDKVKLCKELPGFPHLDAYGLTEEELFNYLFAKQALIDANADERKKYTIYGFLLIFPVIVAQVFVNGALPLLLSLCGGACLCGVYWVVARVVYNWKMKRISTPQLEKYVADVLAFRQ